MVSLDSHGVESDYGGVIALLLRTTWVHMVPRCRDCLNSFSWSV